MNNSKSLLFFYLFILVLLIRAVKHFFFWYIYLLLYRHPPCWFFNFSRQASGQFSILKNQYYTHDDEKVWIIQIVFHKVISLRIQYVFHFIMDALMVLFNNGSECDDSIPFFFILKKKERGKKRKKLLCDCGYIHTCEWIDGWWLLQTLNCENKQKERREKNIEEKGKENCFYRKF